MDVKSTWSKVTLFTQKLELLFLLPPANVNAAEDDESDDDNEDDDAHPKPGTLDHLDERWNRKLF